MLLKYYKMNNIIYHEVQPDNNDTAGYGQFSTLDFTLESDGRKLNPNSIRIDFDLEAESTAGTVIDSGDQIFIDNKVGCHALFESYQVEVQSRGIIENLQEAPRWHAVHASSSYSEGDFSNLGLQAEGRGIHTKSGNYILQDVGHKGEDSASHLKSPKYSIRPLICLNRMVGDAYSFSKNGYIKISVNLARNGHVFHGVDVDANVQYTIKNVTLRYTSRPDDGKQGKMMMNSVTNIKTSVNSAQSNIVCRVPSKAVNGVVICFLEQSKEGDLASNNLALEAYGQLDSAEYRFNDATNKYVTYRLEDKGDMVRKGLQALNDGNINQAHARHLNANQGNIIGLPFLEYIDLSTSKFSVELQSGLNNLSANPRLVYLYFLTLIEM